MRYTGRDLSFSQRLTVRSSRWKNAAISFQDSNRRFEFLLAGFIPYTAPGDVRKCPLKSVAVGESSDVTIAHALCCLGTPWAPSPGNFNPTTDSDCPDQDCYVNVKPKGERNMEPSLQYNDQLECPTIGLMESTAGPDCDQRSPKLRCGWKSCSKCNCQEFEGNGGTCGNQGCGHAFQDHW